MKILMVAIPNHHFFQWTNQLKMSGHDVFWFDITDGGPKVERINWVNQIKGWKLKIDYPFRFAIKRYTPKLYDFLQKVNERDVSQVFEKSISRIKPDVVHCFEMKLSGLPILKIMQQNEIPFIYSSWGSDMFYFEEMGVTKKEIHHFFSRTDYLITDCKRDYYIALENGFQSEFLGVFPGNGGLTIGSKLIKKQQDRNTILIKGYDDGVGKASVVMDALALVPKSLFQDKNIVVYSADNSVINQIQETEYFSGLKIKAYSRNHFINNRDLLSLMGESSIHIANSISDGMPNALLEAMGMGVFPIQSNPGGVTEEVITDNKNGYLIHDPFDKKNIAMLIEKALANNKLRTKAQSYNVSFIEKNFSRSLLQPRIVKLYEAVNSKDT